MFVWFCTDSRVTVSYSGCQRKMDWIRHHCWPRCIMHSALCASTSDDFKWTTVHQSDASHLKILQICQWSQTRFSPQQQNSWAHFKSVFLCCFVWIHPPLPLPTSPLCIIHDLAAAVGLLPVPWPIYRVARESISRGLQSANSSLWGERMNPFMAFCEEHKKCK